MEVSPFARELAFVVGADEGRLSLIISIIISIVGRGDANHIFRSSFIQSLKAGRGCAALTHTIEMLFHPLPIVIVIGDDAELPAWLEHTMSLLEKTIGDDPPFVMPFFRPGIAEVQVQHIDERIRRPPTQKLRRVGVKQPDIAQRVAPTAVRCIEPELVGPLDSKEIDGGPGVRCLNEKRPFARADFKLEWVVRVVEPRSGVEPCSIETCRIVGQRRKIAPHPADRPGI